MRKSRRPFFILRLIEILAVASLWPLKSYLVILFFCGTLKKVSKELGIKLLYKINMAKPTKLPNGKWRTRPTDQTGKRPSAVFTAYADANF